MSKPLPTFKTPHYTLTLPLSNKVVTYRGYNVADERLLIAAMESKDEDAKFYMDNILNVITNVITNGLNPRHLPAVDVRFLLVHLRAKSVGEVIELKYKEEPFSINISEIFVDNVRKPEDYKISLNDDIGLKMKDLSFEEESEASIKLNEGAKSQVLYNLLINSIESIYTKDEIWTVGVDITKEELATFIDDVPSEVSAKLYDFIREMPILATWATIGSKKIKLTNKDVDFLDLASPTSQ